MSDLIESRLSEIRELASKDRTTLERARDIIHGASSNLSDAANCETVRESKRLHAASREYLQVAMDVERMLARPSDLEALLAERDGMKAEIERLNARLAWRDHRDSCHPCGSHVRPMCEQGVEIYSRTQSAAPLDPKRLRAGLNDDDRAFVEQTEKWSADAWKTSQADVRRLLAILARLSAPLDPPSETPETPEGTVVQRALKMGLNTRVW